ncbi:MAG: hypothetical protein D6710_00135 [Nitrospirae bacterium]|nr:MAG: hypothetical protein D6710_00135 [Nitrospirota bacterium]
MKRELIRGFANRKPYLFWDIGKPEQLSDDALVEIILTRGDFDDLLWLLSLLSIKEVSDIFFRQISQRRSNYKKRTLNYFKLFFERNSQNV